MKTPGYIRGVAAACQRCGIKAAELSPAVIGALLGGGAGALGAGYAHRVDHPEQPLKERLRRAAIGGLGGAAVGAGVGHLGRLHGYAEGAGDLAEGLNAAFSRRR